MEFTKHEQGTFCWADLATLDTEAAISFYNKLFDWEFIEEPAGEGMTYIICQKNDKTVAAIYEMSKEMREQQIPSHWSNYIAVENVDEMAKKVEEVGGKILVPPFDVGNDGRMCICFDKEGAGFALWQAKESLGSQMKYEDGSLCWVEYASRDRETTAEFYEKLLGWSHQTNKMGEMEYTLFSNGETPVAGLYIMPEFMEGVPAHWLPYFETNNIDDLIAKVKFHDGEIAMPKAYAEGVGHFCVVKDPQGGVFGVVQSENK